MATYKAIHGVNIQYRDSDATVIEGDVWYNSSTGKLKMYSAVGAWASGGNMNTGRKAPGGGAGTLTAGLIFGGGDPDIADAETYDGSSWTEVNNLNTARREVGPAPPPPCLPVDISATSVQLMPSNSSVRAE